MEFADFFEMDRLSEHDEEQLIESAMQLQQVMLLYEAGIREIKGQEGVVTLELRDDFVGTIRVHSASGSLVSYDARPAEGIARIPVGQAVTVVEVDPERMVCIAAPLEDKQES